MRRLLLATAVLAVLLLAGCQWATFREKFTWTPSRTHRKEEGRQEDRSRVRHEVKVRSWRGEDGTIYVQPIIETHDEEDPNDA